MRACAVVLSKGFNGKTRLDLPPEEKRRLLSAMLLDIHRELVESGRFETILVATPDAGVQEFCRENGISCLGTDPRGINGALREVGERAVREGFDVLFVTASDLPLFSAGLVEAVLARLEGLVCAHGLGAVFCPSRNLGLTVCAAAPPGSVALSVDEFTQNLLRLDRVAGPTPRALEPRMEAYLDIDTGPDLAETYHLMAEMPGMQSREVYRFLARRFGGAAAASSGEVHGGDAAFTG
ncbi:MAG: hypothetical protein FJ149_10660 [Euryarchaeota archaeon]|nr:hypothetical protein [Euryarchaeota archaeon]